jgi:hypothetical protein
VLALMMIAGVAGALQHRDGNDASPAVPRTVGLERNRQERGKLALSQTDGST